MLSILFFWACLVCWFSFYSRNLILFSIFCERKAGDLTEYFSLWLQQSQAEDILVTEVGKAETGVVWVNKQRHTIRREVQYTTPISKDIGVDFDDRTAQNGWLKRHSQLKAIKPRVKAMTAMLTAQSEKFVAPYVHISRPLAAYLQIILQGRLKSMRK